eukprot:CAMPEP_0170561508 /NCGR_PEP_ID=MMETSP0211-20121228/55221_1 /TAXON_ID=311385 /ORGANISM="Pseudokeronopsis sp., Strain OXSARD2" /LENGTH=295 /DNA_ID=CAMNT_0010877161 /DNA_START=15 /DNA_END=902 /DNA_ORIENTATION=+
MPVKFKDLNKSANDLLNKGFDSDNSVSVKTKASNGVTYTAKVQSKAEGKVSANVGAAFKHSSGLNVKKFEFGNNGKLSADFDLNDVVDNATFSLGVVLLPLDLLAADGHEKVELGVRYTHEKANANLTVSPIAPTSAAFDLTVAPIDNVLVGGSYKGELDDTWTHKDIQAGASYASGDSAVALVASKSLSVFTVSGFHQLDADLAFAGSVQIKKENAREAAATVGASYKLDADTSVKGKIQVPHGSLDDTSATISFKQKINGNVRVTATSKIDLDPNGDDLFGANLALGLELGGL